MTTQLRDGYRGLRTKQAPGERIAALRSRLHQIKRRIRPATRELQENIFTICGFGCGSAAGFLHSTFTGLIVSGILFLAYEWKTGSE